MSVFVITNGRVMLDGYDMSNNFNELNMEWSVDMLDASVFGLSTRKNIPGMFSASASGTFLQDYDELNYIEKPIWDRLGVSGTILSASRTGVAEGDRCYSLKNVIATINPMTGSIGDLGQSTFEARCQASRMIGGPLLGVGTKTSNGNTTTPIQLGAVLSSQVLYGALHVYRPTSGTSVSVVIESDDAQGFSSPTTRLTFTTATTNGAEWKEAAGPITDTWWRAKWTVVSGSFPIFVLIGIA